MYGNTYPAYLLLLCNDHVYSFTLAFQLFDAYEVNKDKHPQYPPVL